MDPSQTRNAFKNVLEVIKSHSLSEKDLRKLPSFQRLVKLSNTKRSWYSYLKSLLLCLVVLKVLIFAILALHQSENIPQSQFLSSFHKVIYKFYLEKMQDLNLSSELCLISFPEQALDLFRPPVDCDVFRNISEVKRIQGTNPDEFESNFAYSGHPVIITDAMHDWSAPETFSFEYFKQVYDEDSPAFKTSNIDCQFFPYQTLFQNLREVFNMSTERANLLDGSEPWYIGWSNCDSNAANALRQHYKRPYFLPTVSESSKTDWIFMGSPGYGAPIHIDNVGDPSWQAQVKGVKKWTLQPPPECYLEGNVLEVTVHPGEIIVLDTDKWFHSTLIEGTDLSITIGSEFD